MFSVKRDGFLRLIKNKESVYIKLEDMKKWGKNNYPPLLIWILKSPTGLCLKKSEARWALLMQLYNFILIASPIFQRHKQDVDYLFLSRKSRISQYTLNIIIMNRLSIRQYANHSKE